MVAIVLLDTNILHVPFKFPVDIFREIPVVMEERTEIVLLSAIKKEIIEKNKRKSHKHVSKQGMAVLKLVKQKIDENKLLLVDVDKLQSESVDEHLVRVAKIFKQDPRLILKDFDLGGMETTINVAIATNDKGVKRMCRNNDIFVIHLRQKNHLELL